MIHTLYSMFEKWFSWDAPLMISPEARTENSFWHSRMEMHKAQLIWHYPFAVGLVY